MTDMLIIDTGAGMLYAPDFAAAAKLHACIAAAYNEIGAVEKLGTNKDQNYKYIAYDDVAVVARKALGKQGLALYCGVCENGVSQTPSASGKSLITRLTLRFVLCESTTGAMLISNWESEAADSGLADKGINKALTAAQKYYLMRLLMLSTKEDDDPDQHGDETDQRRAQAQPQHPTSAQPSSGDSKPPAPAWQAAFFGWMKDWLGNNALLDGPNAGKAFYDWCKAEGHMKEHLGCYDNLAAAQNDMMAATSKYKIAQAQAQPVQA
jgi:hypothetical protein